MPALALAGFVASVALFIPVGDDSSPAAGLAEERDAARTFGERDRFGGPISVSGAGVFLRSDDAGIQSGMRGLLRERRFGFAPRWDSDFRDHGFERHRFAGPRTWDRRFRDREFWDHRFMGPRSWDRRQFHGPIPHRPFGNRSGRFGPRSR